MEDLNGLRGLPSKMEKITDKIAALPHNANYFSLEFFPPKTQEGFSNLQARLSRMSEALRPLFVNVTWGAGGSTAAKSLELAEICQRQLGLTTCLHLTCTNMNRTLIDEALDEAKALGIRNILALRGDPPRSEEYNIEQQEDSNKEFTWAVDLVTYIRKVHGDYFCIGVAGYPEGHSDESNPHPLTQDPLHDLPSLVEKTKAGADFIMTQLTYDIEAYRKYESMLRNHPSGIFKTIPLLPGLMPIQSYQILKRVTKLAHAKVPPAIMARIDAVKTDDEAVKEVGLDIMEELVDGIKAIPSPGGARGLHFYTLNLEKAVANILERCKLIPNSSEPSTPSSSEALDNAIAVSPPSDSPITNGAYHSDRRISRRRASSINSQPHNRVIVDKHSRPGATSSSSSTTTREADALSAGVPAHANRSTNLLISEGQGSLGREATWDDFPNGRWGDARSPAFGEIDGYGPSLHVSPAQARKLWGHPKSHSDISAIFAKHVRGDLELVPWSEGGAADEEGGGGLREETATIRNELLKLIEGKGWWTLASQPAVNGVRSDDPVFGWGPQGEGFVFQKAFVEFFLPHKDFVNILKPVLEAHRSELSWFATNGKGDFESSQDDRSKQGNQFSASGSINAVTWGVFRGKEIVTPTIIEEVSFRAWGDEAYSIWEEWRKVFAKGSAEERFLESEKKDVWLVNVVGQNFVGKDGGRLWEILGGAGDRG